MTKHKDGDHMQSEDDERTVEALYKALDSLDSHIPLLTPDSEWFQQQIQIRQAENRKGLLRELFVFILVALVIMLVLISVALQQPSVFLMVQLISLVIAPIVLVMLSRKQVEV